MNPLREAEYPIAAVSKLTGVSCHALRVWERRYGFPVPHRSASGHRRYGHDQVLILRRVSELSQQGRPISELIAEARAGRLEPAESLEATPTEAPTLQNRLDEIIDRLLHGDFSGAGGLFDELESSLTPENLVTQVIAPALTETGERWFRQRCAVYQERCLSGFLRRRLDRLIESTPPSRSGTHPLVLIGTVQGDRHEGGVLVAHLLLIRAGWRVINLGVDLPVAEYVRATNAFSPDALALSFVLSRNINKRFQELAVLNGIPVFVGGRSILNYQGLARRYGLLPVPGPVLAAIEQMNGAFKSLTQHNCLADPQA